MTRTEFINELSQRLAKRLSAQELQEALTFYSEYFDDAGPEHEQEVIAELGTPTQVAAQIVSERAMAAADEQPQSVKKGLSAVWVVILSLFAAPVALPVAFALVAVMFGLLVAIIAVVVSFWIALIAIAVSGIFMVGVGFAVILKSFAAGVFYLGGGFALIGITLLFVPALLWMANKTFRALASWFNSVVAWFRRRFIDKNKPVSQASVIEER